MIALLTRLRLWESRLSERLERLGHLHEPVVRVRKNLSGQSYLCTGCLHCDATFDDRRVLVLPGRRVR